MSKKTRAEKRAEEERIIAEMEEAMKEKKSASDGGMVENTDQNPDQTQKADGQASEQKPKSDFYTYQPMNERTVRRVRMIITGVCIVAIVVYLIVKAVK